MPTAWAGVTAVMELGATLTTVADLPPKVTAAPAWNRKPVITTDVPPAVGPEVGEIDRIRGRRAPIAPVVSSKVRAAMAIVVAFSLRMEAFIRHSPFAVGRTT
jgi:hypothetical protein